MVATAQEVLDKALHFLSGRLVLLQDYGYRCSGDDLLAVRHITVWSARSLSGGMSLVIATMARLSVPRSIHRGQRFEKACSTGSLIEWTPCGDSEHVELKEVKSE